jgi:hypothetical protein
MLSSGVPLGPACVVMRARYDVENGEPSIRADAGLPRHSVALVPHFVAGPKQVSQGNSRIHSILGQPHSPVQGMHNATVSECVGFHVPVQQMFSAGHASGRDPACVPCPYELIAVRTRHAENTGLQKNETNPQSA